MPIATFAEGAVTVGLAVGGTVGAQFVMRRWRPWVTPEACEACKGVTRTELTTLKEALEQNRRENREDHRQLFDLLRNGPR